jgi:hypothetical protein
MASSDARPVPIKNTAYRHYFCFRKNDGTLITTWAGMDSEVSKDGGNFADCTNEATEIQTSGCGYIDLTSTEMNADSVVLKATVTNTDALPYVCTLFPNEGGDIDVDVTYVGGSAASGAGTIDANVVQISGDSTAADNLELAYENGSPQINFLTTSGSETAIEFTTGSLSTRADEFKSRFLIHVATQEMRTVTASSDTAGTTTLTVGVAFTAVTIGDAFILVGSSVATRA